MFRLLKKGIKLDQAQATTILLGAAYLDQAQVIKRALDLGADVNGVSDRDPRGRTALALAIDAGNSHLVKLLVEAEASLAAVDKDGTRYEGTFVEGQRNGKFIVKSSDGKVIRECIYNLGHLEQ